MTSAMKKDPETGAELLLFTRPFTQLVDDAYVWVDDEGQEYPATHEELHSLGLSPL